MNAQAVTLHLPTPLFDQLQRRARETRRSVEAEILDVVASAVHPAEDDLPPDLQAAVAPLRSFSDEALRRAARDHFPTQAAARFSSLNNKQQRDGLSSEEAQELAELRQGYERVMVVRAAAAALLKERGYDVSSLLS